MAICTSSSIIFILEELETYKGSGDGGENKNSEEYLLLGYDAV
jgi:hypothetical protein